MKWKIKSKVKTRMFAFIPFYCPKCLNCYLWEFIKCYLNQYGHPRPICECGTELELDKDMALAEHKYNKYEYSGTNGLL